MRRRLHKKLEGRARQREGKSADGGGDAKGKKLMSAIAKKAAFNRRVKKGSTHGAPGNQVRPGKDSASSLRLILILWGPRASSIVLARSPQYLRAISARTQVRSAREKRESKARQLAKRERSKIANGKKRGSKSK